VETERAPGGGGGFTIEAPPRSAGAAPINDVAYRIAGRERSCVQVVVLDSSSVHSISKPSATGCMGAVSETRARTVGVIPV
jgi:hypothetical protein